MAQHVKTFPAKDLVLKITVNYPDELLDCVDNPRDWYTIEELEKSEEGKSLYPDMMLIPRDGSYIKKVHVTKKVTNGKTGSKTEEYDEDQGQHWWNFWVENFTFKRYECRTHCFYRINTGLGHKSYLSNHKEANGTSNAKDEGDIEYIYDIEGEPAYFDSNAEFYYAYHNDTMKKDYAEFMDCFPKPHPLGCLQIREGGHDGKIIDMWAISLLEGEVKTSAKEQYFYSNITGRQCKVVNGKPVALDEFDVGYKKGDILTHGFHWSSLLTRSLPDGSGTYEVKGKYFRFCAGVMMSISPYIEGEPNTYVGAVRAKTPDEVCLAKQEYDDLKIQRTESNPEAGECSPIDYYSTGKEDVSLYVTEDDMLNWGFLDTGICGKMNWPEFESSSGYGMIGVLATMKDGKPEYLTDPEVSSSIPICEYGVNLHPVFVAPMCHYLKLNCTKECDERNAIGDETSTHNYFMGYIGDFQDDDRLCKNVNTYDQDTLKVSLRQLKNSRANMKILYINGVGAKDPATDKTVVFLSKDKNVYIDYDTIKYLLKDRRKDEYYFIYCSASYGGGLFENQVHNNVESEDYGEVKIPDELGKNFFIWYSDCANSPAWGKKSSPGEGLDTLFQFPTEADQSLPTYFAWEEKINGLVAKTRQLNFTLLKEHMVKYYDFIKEIFQEDTLNWTESNTNLSTTRAENLIFKLSRAKSDEEAAMIKDYPICFWFDLFYKMYFSNALKMDDELVNAEDFTRKDDYYPKFADCFATKYEDKLVSNADKYLHPSSMNLATGGIGFTYRENFKKYINFFYEMYEAYNKMVKNSEELRQLNNFEKGMFVTFYLDEKPGIVNKFDKSFQSCYFPRFPDLEDYKYNGADFRSLCYNRNDDPEL